MKRCIYCLIDKKEDDFTKHGSYIREKCKQCTLQFMEYFWENK